MSWNTKHRLHFAAALGALIAVLAFYSEFLKRIEHRSGVVLDDPILSHLPVHNLNWIIFGLINGSLLLGVIYLFKKPERLILGLKAYALMVLIRMAVMYVLPLDPPIGMVVLQDPIVEYFGSNQHSLTRDLFFSGHTATLFLLSLLATSERVKLAFQVATILVAAALLIQHVHYAVDVMAAPFFAYGSLKLVDWIQSRG